MIRKLRRKLVIMLMCVVSLILIAVFAAMLISFRSDNRHTNENILRQALASFPERPEFRPHPNMEEPGSLPNLPEPGPPPNRGARTSVNVVFSGRRMPILVAGVGGDDGIVLLIHQLHFMDEAEAESVVQVALGTNEARGVLHDYKLRWLKSEDGGRIAFVDISGEQEMLSNLILNALLIGAASLTVFYLISLFLARWAVRPVELAWERQRQFVADASHELKTPLTVILSNAEMLRGKDAFADEKNTRRIKHIQAEASLMKNLIEDLLTLAKSDSAERSAVWESVDFSFIATSSVLTFEPIVFDEQKTVTSDIRDRIFVAGDAQRLSQLIGILLDNAVKYCKAGGEIKVGLKEADRKTALLTVTNDGEAIPTEALGRVFERFYQVDQSRSAPGSFGLGLSIAQGIVAEHGGRIWAESGERVGNSFHVSLPLIPPPR